MCQGGIHLNAEPVGLLLKSSNKSDFKKYFHLVDCAEVVYKFGIEFLI